MHQPAYVSLGIPTALAKAARPQRHDTLNAQMYIFRVPPPCSSYRSQTHCFATPPLYCPRWLLREDMYRQAVSFLPAVQQDMGALCSSSVQEGEGATTMTVSKCCYHEILTKASRLGAEHDWLCCAKSQGPRACACIYVAVAWLTWAGCLCMHPPCVCTRLAWLQEDAPFLLSEFCCHHALLWLHEFRYVWGEGRQE